MSTEKPVLLSVKPRYADAILQGAKTIEVRRRPINAKSDSTILIYSSSPVKSVVGKAQLRRVIVADVELAWKKYSRQLGLTKTEFETYLEGCAAAYLLVLDDVCQLSEPIGLQTLREFGPFHPPQSYRYVNENDPDHLKQIANA